MTMLSFRKYFLFALSQYAKPSLSNLRRLPASLIQPIIFAGLPTTSAKSGTSFVTTEPAPTNENRPIV